MPENPRVDFYSWIGLSEAADFHKRRLREQFDSSTVERFVSSNKNCNGGSNFADRTIKIAMEELGTAEVLSVVVGALNAIVEWPNAGIIAWKMRSFMKFAQDSRFGNSSEEEVIDVFDLIKQIAENKPYGEKTVGLTLLGRDWGQTRINMLVDPGQAQVQKKLILDAEINTLQDLASGEYEGYLDQYLSPPENIE